MTEDEGKRARLKLDARLFLALTGIATALAVAVALLLNQRYGTQRAATVADMLRDPVLRRDLLARVAEQGAGEYDSHPDFEVGRVALNGKRQRNYGTVSVNAFGMREREYALPKPAGTTRVVLLGDSFVYGLGAEQDVRLGVPLERYLNERRTDSGGPIEVLHMGIPSWSLTTECAYLRRQLHLLQPDLVLHVTVSNDLDDVAGVRGFGTFANFAPQHAERADSMAYQNYPTLVLGFPHSSWLCNGFEFEGRSRFETAKQSVLDLLLDLERSPEAPGYLLISYWKGIDSSLHQFIGRHIDRKHLLYVPREIYEDDSLHVPGDGHWNAAGHECMARLLYATIRLRGLLPRLGLQTWPEAEQEADRLALLGWQEARQMPKQYRLSPAIAPHAFDEQSARQVLSGLDREGWVSPHTALVLGRPRGATALHVTGRFLPDRVLEGVAVHVFVEEFELASLVIRPGEAFDESFPLPDETRRRKDLSVRFVTDDYVYRGDDLRHCIVFELERVALE